MAKKFNIIWFIWSVIEVLLIGAAAVLCLSYGADPKPWIAEVISYVLGIFVTISAVVRLAILIVGRRKTDPLAIFLRSVQAAAGISIMTVDITATANVLFWFTAMFLIVIGAVFLTMGIVKMIDTKRFNMVALSHFISAGVAIVIGAILTGVGIYIYNKKQWEDAARILLVIVGIAIAGYAILKIVTTILVMLKSKKTGENVIDIITNPKTKRYYETVEPEDVEEKIEPMKEDTEEKVEPMTVDVED
ncbi:MAG: hypothetical protein MJ239_06695, partial [Bacilli bacterium]|nr:hypothetical protein [Bacilli bacterium]